MGYEELLSIVFDIKPKILKLPIEKQIVIYMDLQGYKQREIAKVLHISQWSVSTILKEIHLYFNENNS